MRSAAPRRPATGSSFGDLLVWATLMVPPFLFLGGVKESFRLPKLMASEWLGLASLVFLAWKLRAVEAGPRDIWRLPAVRALLPALLVASAGFLTTAHPLHFREALIDLWIGAACLVGWSAGLKGERQERILRGLLWPAGALSLLGALQFHGLWRSFRFTGIEYDPRLGLTSLAGNPGDLGVYLVLPSLIAQWALPRTHSGAPRWATAAALSLCLYGVALTQTLAALAALAVGTLVLWLPLLPRRKAVAGLAGGAVLAALLILAVAPLRVRFLDKARQLSEGDLNAVLTGRLDGWRAALWMFERHPVTGVGHGAYRPEFVPAKLALLDRGVEFLETQPQPVFANAHNEYLEVAAEWGILGLLALAWGLTVLFRAASRASGEGNRNRALAWAGLAALAVLSLVHFPFRIALTAFPAILFLAWVLRPVPDPEEAGA